MSGTSAYDTRNLQSLYSQGSVESYDADQAADYDKGADRLDYHAPRVLAKYFCEHAQKEGLAHDSRVLDVAAGTGLVAHYLKEKGFGNVDAVDGSQVMLDQAKQKGRYIQYHCCMFGEPGSLPFADDTYDAAVMTGALSPTRSIPKEIFLDILRVVKPGGLVVHMMRENLPRTMTEFMGLHDMFSTMETEEQWQKLEHAFPEEAYFMGDKGIVHVYRVTKKKPFDCKLFVSKSNE